MIWVGVDVIFDFEWVFDLGLVVLVVAVKIGFCLKMLASFYWLVVSYCGICMKDAKFGVGIRRRFGLRVWWELCFVSG